MGLWAGTTKKRCKAELQSLKDRPHAPRRTASGRPRVIFMLRSQGKETLPHFPGPSSADGQSDLHSEKFLILMKPNLSSFSFVAHAFGVI